MEKGIIHQYVKGMDEVTHIDYEAKNENIDTNADSAPSLGEDLSNFEVKIEEEIKKDE